MVCSKCGNVNNEGVKFCISCGNPLENVNAVNSVNNSYQQASVQQLNVDTTNNVQGNNINQIGTENVNSNNTMVTMVNVVSNDINSNFNPNNINNNVNIGNEKKKSNKKIVFILLGIGVLVALVVVLLIIFLGKDKKNINTSTDDLSVFSDKNIIPIEKDGKYGYVSSDGEIILEPKYNSVGEFHGKYVAVSIDNPDTLSSTKKLYLLLDTEGNCVNEYELHNEPIYYKDNDLWNVDGVLYDANMNKLTPDNMSVTYLAGGYFEWENNDDRTSGIMNQDGKVSYTYTPITDKSVYTSFSVSDNISLLEETYCTINVENDEYAIINCDTGEYVYDFTDKYIGQGKNNIFTIFDSNISRVLERIYIYNNKILYRTTGSNDMTYDGDGYIKVYGDVEKYIDVKTGKILNEKPSIDDVDMDDLFDGLDYHGYKVVSENSKYGIKKNDKNIVPIIYDDIDFLVEDLFNYVKNEKKQELALAVQENKTSLIDVKTQKIITTFDTENVFQIRGSTFLWVKFFEEGSKNISKNLVYNVLTDKSMEFEGDVNITIESNYIKVNQNKMNVYYNTNFKKVYEVGDSGEK